MLSMSAKSLNASSAISGDLGPTVSESDFASVRKSERIAGDVILKGPGSNIRYVHIKVYKTSLEHFAVVYPLRRVGKPLGVINLKNTMIEPLCNGSGILIRQKMFDVTTDVTLQCEASEMKSWMDAFTSHGTSTLIHQTSLPCVLEED